MPVDDPVGVESPPETPGPAEHFDNPPASSQPPPVIAPPDVPPPETVPAEPTPAELIDPPVDASTPAAPAMTGALAPPVGIPVEPADLAEPDSAKRQFAPIAMVAGSIVMIVGTLLTWVDFDSAVPGDRANGFDTYFFGDPSEPTQWESPGAYIVGLALAILVVGVLSMMGRAGSSKVGAAGAAVGIVALVVTLAAWWAVRNVVTRASEFIGFSTGIGIWLALAGAIIAAVGGVVGALKR